VLTGRLTLNTPPAPMVPVVSRVRLDRGGVRLVEESTVYPLPAVPLLPLMTMLPPLIVVEVMTGGCKETSEATVRLPSRPRCLTQVAPPPVTVMVLPLVRYWLKMVIVSPTTSAVPRLEPGPEITPLKVWVGPAIVGVGRAREWFINRQRGGSLNALTQQRHTRRAVARRKDGSTHEVGVITIDTGIELGFSGWSFS